MSEEEKTGASGDAGAVSSVMNVQRRWLGLFRRLLGLQSAPGGMRYVIVITVTENDCDWSVQQAGKVER